LTPRACTRIVGNMKRAGIWTLVVLFACGRAASPPASTGSAAPVAPVARVADASVAGTAAIASEDVRFTVGTITVPGTIVGPSAPGRHPGLVLMAGSGPTDRDWNNPLIANRNGSGKLLAEALAARGIVVLRFDKAGVGGNKASLGDVTFDIYVDEGRAALTLLRARADVDPAHVFLAGHSEGGIHAIRTALAEGDRLTGLVLLSSAGRTMRDILVDQVSRQLQTAAPAQAGALLGPFAKALDDFIAGKHVDPRTATSVPGLQNLLAAVTAPQAAKLSRGLISFDPAPAVAQVAIPVFVFNGQKDVQVDPEQDAKRLVAARAGKDVTLFLAPDANHVLEHEDKPLAALRADLAAVQAGYNAADRVLDPAAVDAIAGWLLKH
jgi:pimeloyl-ACP methyl ester carboxylesterase